MTTTCGANSTQGSHGDLNVTLFSIGGLLLTVLQVANIPLLRFAGERAG
jgi:hypothetical protein